MKNVLLGLAMLLPGSTAAFADYFGEAQCQISGSADGITQTQVSGRSILSEEECIEQIRSSCKEYCLDYGFKSCRIAGRVSCVKSPYGQ